jgi:hypothetical protein
MGEVGYMAVLMLLAVLAMLYGFRMKFVMFREQSFEMKAILVQIAIGSAGLAFVAILILSSHLRLANF